MKPLVLAFLMILVMPLAAHSEEANQMPPNIAQKFNSIKTAAEKGDVDAQVYLGTLYSFKEGAIGVSPGAKILEMYVQQNEDESLKWYRKAADQGHPESQSKVGYYYLNKEDYKEALQWYGRAAAQGNVNAAWNLGQMFKKGQGTETNNEKAYFWELVAEKLNPDYYSSDNAYFSTRLTQSEIDTIKTHAKDWRPEKEPAKSPM